MTDFAEIFEACAEVQRLIDTCMCGDSMDHSPWEGHSPVSMYYYYNEDALIYHD
jgi:hypothetical protein